MSSSSINTRRVLAETMKRLMCERNFCSISVKGICESCGINRKSFYYHYRDKFELVNDIYCIEFYLDAIKKTYDSVWSFFDALCGYINDNRKFYRSAFNVEGQNSFKDYFCDSIKPILLKHYSEQGCSEREAKSMADYFAVMFASAIVHWLNEKRPMPASEFSKFIYTVCSQVSNASLSIKDYSHSDSGIFPYAYN